jgi:MFS family permease
MKGKPGVGQLALAMIPLTGFFEMLGATDTLQSILYLLKNPDYYDLNNKEAKDVAASSSSYATFISIPTIFMAGIFFEMIGRRNTITTCFIMQGICCIIFVAGSPSTLIFSLTRIVFQCFLMPIIVHPLVNDYVQVQYRGRATALQQQGQILGNLLSVAAIFTLTDSFDSQWLGFGIMCFCF